MAKIGERNGIWLSYFCNQTLRKKEFYEEKLFHSKKFEKNFFISFAGYLLHANGVFVNSSISFLHSNFREIID